MASLRGEESPALPIVAGTDGAAEYRRAANRTRPRETAVGRSLGGGSEGKDVPWRALAYAKHSPPNVPRGRRFGNPPVRGRQSTPQACKHAESPTIRTPAHSPPIPREPLSRETWNFEDKAPLPPSMYDVNPGTLPRGASEKTRFRDPAAIIPKGLFGAEKNQFPQPRAGYLQLTLRPRRKPMSAASTPDISN